MSNVLGPSSPPVMNQPEPPLQIPLNNTYGISASGSIVGAPPAIDPVVGALYGRLRLSHGMGNK